ncbi:MAG: hypothetical protein HN350_01770 [Phycisphaerales bacterium]|jgi:hypothetical protein|nr:hypothetical protein [Phycisphaerales bacterium]
MLKRIILPCAPVLMVLWAIPVFGQDKPAPVGNVQSVRQELQELRAMLKAQAEAHKAEINRLNSKIEQLQESRLVGDGESSGEDQLAGVLDKMLDDAGTREQPGGWFNLGRTIQSFNPEISIIGDFVGHYDSREGGELDDQWLFRELEIGISGSVDAHSRADIFLGIHKAHEHEEGHEAREPGHLAHGSHYEIHVEEAYLTLLDMPWDLQAKVGKFRAKFGQANTRHLHALPWVEYPLVVRDYFGPEGLAGEGVSVSWLVPNPWDKYIELTYESLHNDDGNMFAGHEADDFVHLAHLKTFHDLDADSTLEVGFSAATAPNDHGHGGRRTWMEGVDLTYKWRHPRKGLYKALAWRTEVIAAQKELADRQENTIGLYTAADYQFARQWAVGGRYDFSQWPEAANLHENAWSAYLTFLQSEFCSWRLGYQYSRRNFEVGGSPDDHQVFLQLIFGLGPHRAHKY